MFHKILIVAIALFFILILVFVNTSKQPVNIDSEFVLPENHLRLEGVSLVRVLDINGGYLTMTAKTAYFDHNLDLLTMTDAEFDMVRDNTRLTANAERGVYKLNDTLTVRGNISGIWNDLEYTVAEEGSFFYDFNTGGAYVGDDVAFTKNYSNIFAKNLSYDGVKDETYFTGGVKMIVIEEDF